MKLEDRIIWVYCIFALLVYCNWLYKNHKNDRTVLKSTWTFILLFRKLCWKENIHKSLLALAFLIARTPFSANYLYISETLTWNIITSEEKDYFTCSLLSKRNVVPRALKPKMHYNGRQNNGMIFLVSFFHSWVMVLKLHKIVHFLQICADLSNKSKSIKAIYLYQSERPHHAFSENSIFCRGLTNSWQDIEE